MLNQAFAQVSGGLVGLPTQGTEIATQYDHLYAFLFWLSVFFFVLVVGGMIFLAVRYRAGRGERTKYITGNHALEALWTVIPAALLMLIFVWGYVVYSGLTHAPSNSMEVRVIAKQWNWTFQYDDGRTEPYLFVPANTPVKLLMTSEDVLHAFYVPNFRLKQDVVPGMYTSAWFETGLAGKHHIFCAEYCGASHSTMESKVVVLDAKQWTDFKAGKQIDVRSLPAVGVGGDTLKMVQASAQPSMSLADRGKALTEQKGCTACHAPTEERKIGPGWKGVFGHKVELADGSSVTADENYIRESIENPNAKVVKGFPAAMTAYKGQLSEEELTALIAYIKSLK